MLFQYCLYSSRGCIIHCLRACIIKCHARMRSKIINHWLGKQTQNHFHHEVEWRNLSCKYIRTAYRLPLYTLTHEDKRVAYRAREETAGQVNKRFFTVSKAAAMVPHKNATRLDLSDWSTMEVEIKKT